MEIPKKNSISDEEDKLIDEEEKKAIKKTKNTKTHLLRICTLQCRSELELLRGIIVKNGWIVLFTTGNSKISRV